MTPGSLLSLSPFFSTLLQHTPSYFFPATLCRLNPFSYPLLWPNRLFSCLLNSPSKLGNTKFSIIHYTSRSITLRCFFHTEAAAQCIDYDQTKDDLVLLRLDTMFMIENRGCKLKQKLWRDGELLFQISSEYQPWRTMMQINNSSLFKYTGFGTVKVKGLF